MQKKMKNEKPKTLVMGFLPTKSTYKELKDYIDEINQNIYFTIEEGIKLYNDYGDICKKYQKLFNERLKIDKKNKLKSQLEKMEMEDDEYES